MNFSYPGDPVFVYDHLTGDISEWWDHSFSEKPYKLFIEARPGGGFYEIVRQVWEHFLWEQFKPYIEEHYKHRQVYSTLNGTRFSRYFPVESTPLIRISYSPFISAVRNDIR